MKLGGIYQITNLVNGKSYVGSTKDLEKREKNHFHQLKNSRHHNIHLQRSYDKHGEGVFVFDWVVRFEIASRDQLFYLEEEYIEEIDPEYNIGGIGGDNISNHPNLDSIREKHRSNSKNKAYTISQLEFFFKQNLEDSNPNWKGGKSKFTCPKCGKVSKNQGQTCCMSCRDSAGTANPFYGKSHPEDLLNRITCKNKLRTSHPDYKNDQMKRIGVTDSEGNLTEYKCTRSVSEVYGCSLSNVSHACRADKIPTRGTFKGLKLEYLD